MKKSKTQTLNLFLKKKSPIPGLTILHLIMLIVALNIGAVAAIISELQGSDAPTTPTNPPLYETTSIKKESASEQTTQQDNVNAQDATPVINNSGDLSNRPDQYGCVPSSAGYDSCVFYSKKNALSAWCSEQSYSAGGTYNLATDMAKAAYDEVMAEWDAVKDLPYYQRHPYEQYATDAKTKHNAISKPAYTAYVSTINSLNTQGCNEILTYSDTS